LIEWVLSETRSAHEPVALYILTVLVFELIYAAIGFSVAELGVVIFVDHAIRVDAAFYEAEQATANFVIF